MPCLQIFCSQFERKAFPPGRSKRGGGAEEEVELDILRAASRLHSIIFVLKTLYMRHVSSHASWPHRAQPAFIFLQVASGANGVKQNAMSADLLQPVRTKSISSQSTLTSALCSALQIGEQWLHIKLWDKAELLK